MNAPRKHKPSSYPSYCSNSLDLRLCKELIKAQNETIKAQKKLIGALVVKSQHYRYFGSSVVHLN